MNDLISRQAAIEAISYSEIAFYPGDNEGDCLRRDSDIKQAIMALPSAQPERKKGRWIPFDIPWYKCSECGAVRENKSFMENFCPNCGARMEQEERK